MSLQLRITGVVVTGILAVAAVLVGVAVISSQKMNQRVADAVYLGNTLIWDQLVEDHLQRLSASVEQVNNEFELRAALKRGEHDEVRTYADRYVNLTGDLGQYDALLLFDREGRQLYSSDEALVPLHLGEHVQQVAAKSEQQRDLAVTQNGVPVGMVAFPLQSRRKLIGIGVLIKGLSPVVERLAARGDFAVGVIAPDGAHPVLDKGLPEETLLQPLLGEGQGDAIAVVEQGDALLLASRQPVHDAAGRVLGHLLIARDDSAKLAQIRSFQQLTVLVVVLAFLGGILGLYFLLKHYLSPLLSAADAASEIAGGNLAAQVSDRGVAEVAQLQGAMGQMVRSLRTMVGEIDAIAGRVSDSAKEMGAAMSHAHDGTARQRSESESVSAALHEMAASISEVASLTATAAEAAQAITIQSNEGMAVMQEHRGEIEGLADEMNGISGEIEQLEQRVTEVGSVIGVIQGISEQTNLLALNAAIEAARAGEAGRGFAVVADEVRGLSARTRQSTVEIEAIIDELQRGTGSAVQRIHQAREHTTATVSRSSQVAERFVSIQQHMEEMLSRNQRIADALEGQRVTADGVSRSMVAIHELAEENVGTSDNALATSRTLAQLADEMNRLTGRFSYDGEAAPEFVEEQGAGDTRHNESLDWTTAALQPSTA